MLLHSPKPTDPQDSSTSTPGDRIRIGISACLLGQQVRFNGGDCRDRFIIETLGKYMDFVPVCPEVEAGFPIPREPFRLVGDPSDPRFVTSKTSQDYTDRMRSWAQKRVVQLEQEDLCGFIFKSDSPSSGMERVKVYSEKGMPRKQGIGMFARAFMEHFPLLPVEEEGRLHDPGLREHFIESIFVLQRWREAALPNPTPGRLVDFQSRHKLLCMARSPELLREMGRIVAATKAQPIRAVYGQYEEVLLNLLKRKATIPKHVNVLEHTMGYFRKLLSSDEKQELLEVIQRYRSGFVPLIVPVTLLNHYVRKFEEPYLKQQYYLNPHPLELKLRNHV
jgi:uncharacterized protein YbgA (DUF1722 family)/uncharacterized protein YbbK (DUF523 family)